jgi:phospholipase/carboxylesterase
VKGNRRLNDASKTDLINIKDWVIRARAPLKDLSLGPIPVVMFLHGWTGDENVTWVFAPRIPEQYLILAPRGIYGSSMGGYGWHPDREEGWPAIDDFRGAVARLLELLDELPLAGRSNLNGSDKKIWKALAEADFSKIGLVGFSQGAALAYTFSLLHPERVNQIAGLAGFMPEGAEELVASRPLAGKTIFVTHGIRDDRVPVDKARRSVELLEQAGAEVTYCEEDVGHKLSASCFKSLGAYYKDHS